MEGGNPCNKKLRYICVYKLILLVYDIVCLLVWFLWNGGGGGVVDGAFAGMEGTPIETHRANQKTPRPSKGLTQHSLNTELRNFSRSTHMVVFYPWWRTCATTTRRTSRSC